ncbi:hypothetical protein [Bacillus sp. UNC438CL73TsuS30]|uniref:hypothetical protein n=1 Tax=Bacillus sp. UNC438CL73TsuS30 TaxID=1340434 RepID=UPI00047E7B18|nr:hypothetical protein [Bacillus sp. UNC438CL73TsuS30]
MKRKQKEKGKEEEICRKTLQKNLGRQKKQTTENERNRKKRITRNLQNFYPNEITNKKNITTPIKRVKNLTNQNPSLKGCP